MALFAIADLHLGHAVDKPMDVFGERWVNHAKRMESAWTAKVGAGDTVLIPGIFHGPCRSRTQSLT